MGRIDMSVEYEGVLPLFLHGRRPSVRTKENRGPHITKAQVQSAA